MGLLDKFTAWSESRLRLSQIKILFQNQTAIEFARDELEAGIAMNDQRAISMTRELDYLQLSNNDWIVQLSFRNIVPDPASAEMFQVNKAMRNTYAGLMQGKQAFRAQMGQAAGENTPFEKRFMPASGWKNFGDSEWDQMLRKALTSRESDLGK